MPESTHGWCSSWPGINGHPSAERIVTHWHKMLHIEGSIPLYLCPVCLARYIGDSWAGDDNRKRAEKLMEEAKG